MHGIPFFPWFVASSFECWLLFSSFLSISLDVMGGRSRWLYALLTVSHCSVSRAYANPDVCPSYGRCCLGYIIRSLEDRVPPMVQDHSNFSTYEINSILLIVYSRSHVGLVV